MNLNDAGTGSVALPTNTDLTQPLPFSAVTQHTEASMTESEISVVTPTMADDGSYTVTLTVTAEDQSTSKTIYTITFIVEP